MERNLCLGLYFVLTWNATATKVSGGLLLSLGSMPIVSFPSLISTRSFFKCLGHVHIFWRLGSPVSCFLEYKPRHTPMFFPTLERADLSL
uniref:Putative secreted protein n=1 Tax=Ixodes ricinus TaxID=34613 RepID=A0A6B0UBW6_IXORI